MSVRLELKLSLLRTNLIVDGVANAAGLLLQFAAIMVLARLLSPSAYASYILAVAAIAVGEMCSDFGMRMWAVRQYAVGAPLRRTLIQSYEVKLVYTALFAAVMFLLPSRGAAWQEQALVIAISFTQPSTDPLLWCFSGRERIFVAALVTLAWRVILVPAACYVAYLKGGLFGVLLAWFAVNCARLGAEHGLLLRRVPEPMPLSNMSPFPQQSLWQLVWSVLPVGGAFVIMSLYQRVGVFLLDRTAGSLAVSSYGTAFSLVNVPGFVSVRIAAAFFPRLSREAHAGNGHSMKAVFNTGILLIGALYAVASIAGVLCMPSAVALLLPKSLEQVGPVAQVLLPGLYISTINVYLKYSLNALGRNIADVAASALGIVVFAVVLIARSWPNAAIGAAIAWNIGELSIFMIRSHAIRKDGRIPTGVLFGVGAGYPCICIACYFLSLIA